MPIIQLILIAACFPALLSGSPGGEKAQALEVLIVSPGQEAETKALQELLEAHGLSVTLLGWEAATRERAASFDLVIVTGPGRRIEPEEVVLDYNRPILGIGPYGCRYFGLLKLKNGHPYT
jgi:hypothetical protein